MTDKKNAVTEEDALLPSAEYRLSYVFRLYPTKAQQTTLAQTLETCRLVYNSLLNWRKHDYQVLGKHLFKAEQQAAFPEWKKAHPELCAVYAQVLQNVAVRVDRAFAAFFRRVKAGETPGFPRFKGKGYDSLTYPQCGANAAKYGGFKLGKESVYLPKIGQIKAHIHRTVDGVPKTCTVRRIRHKWYVYIVCEVQTETLSASEEAVGVDVGLRTFAALSNGENIGNPRFFRTDEKALVKAQRKLQQQKYGTKARKKAKKTVGRIHERIRNRRHNFIHQTARRIVNRYGVIVAEKIEVQKMIKRPEPKQDAVTGEYLRNGAAWQGEWNKSILDAAWATFRMVLSQKAARAGRVYAEVAPEYTSQTCSGCGAITEISLQQRQYNCQYCGLSLDRDTNAAINILSLGQQRDAGAACEEAPPIAAGNCHDQETSVAQTYFYQ